MSHWISKSVFQKKGNIRDNWQKYIYILRRCNKYISYTCARENVIEGLENIGPETKLFGLHSLRAGGATAAANLGVNDRLFKKHGRWKSEKVKDGYIHESIEAKLIVTKNLGL